MKASIGKAVLDCTALDDVLYSYLKVMDQRSDLFTITIPLTFVPWPLLKKTAFKEDIGFKEKEAPKVTSASEMNVCE